MPRKKKVTDISEKINITEAEIESLTAQLADKKAELEQLKAEKLSQDQQMLIEAMNETGVSVDEVAEFIRSKAKGAAE